MEAFEHIHNHEAVLKRFGQWPSFHDGEVHRITLDCVEKHGTNAPATLDLLIRGWITTSEVTEAGFFKTENDSIVHFRFYGVSEVELDGFNHQNVLSCLELALDSGNGSDTPMLHVNLVHCFGLAGSFAAQRGEVISVVPYMEAVDA